MSTFQERVKAEKWDLDDNLQKLGHFLAYSAHTVSEMDRLLLAEQLGHMRAYSGVLAARIERFGA